MAAGDTGDIATYPNRGTPTAGIAADGIWFYRIKKGHVQVYSTAARMAAGGTGDKTSYANTGRTQDGLAATIRKSPLPYEEEEKERLLELEEDELVKSGDGEIGSGDAEVSQRLPELEETKSIEEIERELIEALVSGDMKLIIEKERELIEALVSGDMKLIIEKERELGELGE